MAKSVVILIKFFPYIVWHLETYKKIENIVYLLYKKFTTLLKTLINYVKYSCISFKTLC